jgi:hypothetical protein
MVKVYCKEEWKKLFKKTSTKTKNGGEFRDSNIFMLVTIQFMMHYAEIKKVV